MSQSPVIKWIHRHDESWLFVLSYVALAVLLSIFISLFWLVAVVLVHFVFELIRQSATHQTKPRIMGEAAWEVKLDIVLVLSALVLALYMDAILGILGLRSAAQLSVAAKTSAQASVRAGGWGQALRGLLITVDDAAHVVKPVVKRMGGKNGANGGEDKDSHQGHDSSPFDRKSWTKGDYATMTLFALMIGLMVISPLLTENSMADSIHILLEELHPFPPGLLGSAGPD